MHFAFVLTNGETLSSNLRFPVHNLVEFIYFIHKPKIDSCYEIVRLVAIS